MPIDRWLCLLSLSVLGTFSSRALGQPDARAAGLQLFQEAEKLSASGDAAGACRKYGDSYGLDPQLEPLLRWAACLEQEGKLASAYAAFRDAAELAQRSGDARWTVTEARAKALKPRVSFITIEVPQQRQLSTLVIERDGFRLGSSAWGVPIPLDPGRHTIRASAYGYREWQTTVEISTDGAAPYVEVPMLERAPDVPVLPTDPTPPVAPPPPPPAPAAPAPGGVVAANESAAPDDRPRARDVSTGGKLRPTRIAALTAGGAGLVGLGAGLYFLAQTRGTLQERDAICPSGRDCEPGTNQRLAALTEQARRSQRTEVICFVVGGAAVTLGAVLWLLPAGKSRAALRSAWLAPVVHSQGGGLLVQGEL